MADFEHERINKADPYGPSNPHPAWQKDPNIKNEFGHTHYPKFVKSLETGGKVIVESENEEIEVSGGIDVELQELAAKQKAELDERVARLKAAKEKKVAWGK